MIPFPELKVTDKTLPVLESLGIHLDRMIEIQMSAYPECWSVEDRREMAENYLAMRSLCSRRSGGSSTPSPAVSALPGASHYRGDGL
jgi:hypothetical protein